jgi:hypothetical protein
MCREPLPPTALGRSTTGSPQAKAQLETVTTPVSGAILLSPWSFRNNLHVAAAKTDTRRPVVSSGLIVRASLVGRLDVIARLSTLTPRSS